MKKVHKKASHIPVVPKLNKEETARPATIIEDFFSYATLAQARENLWNWLEATVTGGYNHELNRLERCNLVFFYQQLQKLLEAVHAVHLDSKNKKSSG